MTVSYGDFKKPIILFVSLILFRGHACKRTKEITLPAHVDNYVDTLIWAVKIPQFQEPVKERETVFFKDDFDDVLEFESNFNVSKNISLAKAVAVDCGLVYISNIPLLKDTYLLGFNVSKTDNFIPISKSSEFNQKNYEQIASNHLHIKNVHDHHLRTLPLSYFKIISDKVKEKLDSHPFVMWFSQQHIRERTKRGHIPIFQDPYFQQQWHLVNRKDRSMDINVTDVWDRNVTGQGVTVAIVDDGVQWDNLDLKDNFNKDGSWDLNSNDPDPTPNPAKSSNHHGTRCAGEIAAVRNKYCSVGVAFDAQFSGLRVLDGPMTDSLEAEAFNKNLQINDIYSCSWGPDDDGKTVDGPHFLAQGAMRYGIDYGRKGYGSIFVVASGNGGRFGDNCNFDGYANSIYTVTIGAVDETGHMPFYAEKCASMLAVTFSSGNAYQRSIVTTDWTLHGGTGCTKSHSGTSAAAPLAAGMIALMLQARPCLTWRDVQYIIIMTAQKVDVDEAEWKRNSAGLFHSHKHGFGLMKVWRLVNAAKIWNTVPWITSFLHNSGDIDTQIPKGVHNPLKIKHTVTEEDVEGLNLLMLEHVQLFVTITHPCRGKLEIVLVCPSGTHSVIAASRDADKSTAGFSDWTFNTVRCWGEEPTGEWILIIKDKDVSSYGPGSIKNWKLKLYGTSMSREQFTHRKRLIEESMDGRYLNDSFNLPCPEQPVYATPTEPMSQKTLKFIALASIFCLVMALYETFEYAVCYREEKKQQQQKMIKQLKQTQRREMLSSDNHLGDTDESESQRLLGNYSDGANSMESFSMNVLNDNENKDQGSGAEVETVFEGSDGIRETDK